MNTIQANQAILQQMIDLVNALDNPTYRQALESFNGSSIGQHFRHIIGFYQCIFNCDNHTIDYSRRERNKTIETENQTAISVLNQLQSNINKINATNQVNVLTDFSSNFSTDRDIVNSTYGRELMYAFDHAIHHLAIIKIGLKVHFPKIAVDENLGVAPSTIQYQKTVISEQ